jgi:DNA-binding response OmpR family regulator
MAPERKGEPVATQRVTIKGAPARRRGRVLLVIDQPVLAAVVTLALKHGPFITRTAQDVALATSALTEWQPHLAIVDMDIGQGQLLAALGEAVPSTGHIPVIALTRRGDLKTKLAAFEWGVEDILTVPFSLAELVARILVVMRRHYRAAIAFAPTIRLGELEIDLLNHRVRAGAAELHLTSVEQSLLYLLAANAGRVVTRDEILDALWGADYLADSNVVDQHIRNLRTKLQDHWRRPRYITTVRGRGYRFVPRETAAETVSPPAVGPNADEEAS